MTAPLLRRCAAVWGHLTGEADGECGDVPFRRTHSRSYSWGKAVREAKAAEPTPRASFDGRHCAAL
jgi:hypothetical protein